MTTTRAPLYDVFAQPPTVAYDIASQTICGTAVESPWLTPVDPITAALSQLYGSPAATESEPKAAEGDHRRFPRRMAEGYVSIVRYPPGTELTSTLTDWLMRTSGLTGELVDLSRSGLALLLLQPLEVGEAIVARLSHQDSDGTLDAIAQVVRVLDIGDHRWKIMAEFVQPLDFDAAYNFARHDQETLPPLFPTRD